MKNAKISVDEQRKIRVSAKSELELLEKIQGDSTTILLLDSFKNKFNICETVYKVILQKHQDSKGKPDNGYLKVMMTQVPYALSFAGYTFNKDVLNELFGASAKKVQQLKNCVMP